MRTHVAGWACVDGRVKSCISNFAACGKRAYFNFPCAKTHSILRFFGCLYILLIQIATQWTASVHTLHMSKPVM